MKRKPKQPDEFSRHEVYDRASVVLDLFCSSVADHPVVAADKELSAAAEKVCEVLYEFYNKSAAKLMPTQPARKRKRR